MKRLRYFTCIGMSAWLMLIFTTTNIFAQEPLPPALDSDAPLTIVVQSINAEAGAIQWVMIILAAAFLVGVTLLLNGFVQQQLKTTVSTEGRHMSLEEHMQRQSDQNA